MKRYEGLVIIKHTVRDEVVKDVIDKVSAEITAAGGKVETVQKMDRKPFLRVADRKQPSGFYTNFIFEAPPNGLAQLRLKLAGNDDVFRSLITEAPEPKEAGAAKM